MIVDEEEDVANDISSQCYQQTATIYSPNTLSGECRKRVPSNLKMSCWTDSFLMSLCHLAQNPIVEEIVRLASETLEASAAVASPLVTILPFVLFVMQRLVQNETVTMEEVATRPGWREAMQTEQMPGKVLENPNLLVCFFRLALQRHVPKATQNWTCDTFDAEDVWAICKRTIPALDDYFVLFADGEQQAKKLYLDKQSVVYPDWEVKVDASIDERMESLKLFLIKKFGWSRPKAAQFVEEGKNKIIVKPFLDQHVISQQNKPFLVTIVPRAGERGFKDRSAFPIVERIGPYDLISVTWHSGTTSGGHHTCYLKCQNQWLLADDCPSPTLSLVSLDNSSQRSKMEMGSNMLVYVRREEA